MQSSSSTEPSITAPSRKPPRQHSVDRWSAQFSSSPTRRSRSFDESPPVRKIEVTPPNSRSLSPKPRTTRSHDRRITTHKSNDLYIEVSNDRVLTKVCKESLSNESIHQFFSPSDPPLRQSRFDDILPQTYDEYRRIGSPRRPERRGSGGRFEPVGRDRSFESPRRPVLQASILEPRRGSLAAATTNHEYAQASPVKRCATQRAFCSPSEFPSMGTPVETSHATSKVLSAAPSPVKRCAARTKSAFSSPAALRSVESPEDTRAVPEGSLVRRSPVKRSTARTQSAFCSPSALRSLESPQEEAAPKYSSPRRNLSKRSTPRTQSAICSPGELPAVSLARPTERRRSIDLSKHPTPKVNKVERTRSAIIMVPKMPARKSVDVDVASTKQPLEDLNPKPAKETTENTNRSSLRRETLLKRCITSTAGKSSARDTPEDRDTQQQHRMMKLYRKGSQESSSTIQIKTVPSVFPKRFSLTAINMSDAALFYSPPRNDLPQETTTSPMPVEDLLTEHSLVIGTPPKDVAPSHRRRNSLDFSCVLQSPRAMVSPRKKSPPFRHRRSNNNDVELPMTALGIESVKSFGSGTASTADVSDEYSGIYETKPLIPLFQQPPSGDSMSCLYHQSLRFGGDDSAVLKCGENMSMKSADLDDSILIGGNDSLCLYGKG